MTQKSCAIGMRNAKPGNHLKVIAHPCCARFWHVQNERDFPQTKLDSETNAPFLLNEHGDPRLFFQVSAKNSQIKNIFEREKKFDSRT